MGELGEDTYCRSYSTKWDSEQNTVLEGEGLEPEDWSYSMAVEDDYRLSQSDYATETSDAPIITQQELDGLYTVTKWAD